MQTHPSFGRYGVLPPKFFLHTLQSPKLYFQSIWGAGPIFLGAVCTSYMCTNRNKDTSLQQWWASVITVSHRVLR